MNRLAIPFTSFSVSTSGSQSLRWRNVRDHAILFAVIYSLYLLGLGSSWVLIVGGILCLVNYLVMALRETRRSPLKFSPLSFYFFWYSNSFGLSAIYMGTIIASGDWISFSVAQVSPEFLVKGYLIALLASLALHFGMELFRPLPAPSGNQDKQPEQANIYEILLVAVLWAVGIIQALNPEWFSFLGTALITPLQRGTIAAVCYIAMRRPASLGISPAIHKMLLAFGTLGLFFANLQSGSKAIVMYAFFPLFWLFIVRDSLRRWLPLMILGLAMFYLFVVAPIITTSRFIRQGSEESVVVLLLRSYDYIGEMGEVTLSDQVESYLMRQFDPTPIGFLVGDVAEKGFRNGETMEYAAYAFIPRFIWPDKPAVSRGAWFTVYLGFAEDEKSATTSTGITATGELYWNFGIWGVIAGMGVIGAMIGGLWRMATANPIGDIFQMMLYTSIMLNMPDMPEAVTTVAGLIALFLIFKTISIVLPASWKTKKVSKVSHAIIPA